MTLPVRARGCDVCCAGLSNCQTFARLTTDLERISKKQLRNTIEGGVNNNILYMKSVDNGFLSQIEAALRRIEVKFAAVAGTKKEETIAII